jgi:hypothetical protein
MVDGWRREDVYGFLDHDHRRRCAIGTIWWKEEKRKRDEGEMAGGEEAATAAAESRASEKAGEEDGSGGECPAGIYRALILPGGARPAPVPYAALN